MPVRKISAGRAGITEVPEQVVVSAPFGTREDEALVQCLQVASAHAQASRLEGRAAEIGALLERLGYPGSLGWYAVHPGAVESVPTGWEWDRDLSQLPTEASDRGWVEARIDVHPALIWGIDEPDRKRRAAQMLANALVRIALSDACASRGEVGAAQRFAYDAALLHMEAVRTLDWEEQVLRGEKDLRDRKAGAAAGNATVAGKAAPRRARWQSRARAIWKRRPGLSANAVAKIVNEKTGATAHDDTVRKAIRHLKPGARKLGER